MSRSYRKPYSSCTGAPSAKEDKQLANRSVRSRQNQYLKQHWENESFLIPHKLECNNNEVYGWSRDGKVKLQRTDRWWNTHCMLVNGCFD